MRFNQKKIQSIFSLFLYAFLPNVYGVDNNWELLESGLEYAEFLSPQKSLMGDSKIRVLRINTNYFDLQLLNASEEKNGALKTTKQWSEKYNLIAAINASMYQNDYLSSVSFMKNKTHINNPRLSKDNTILAFNPKIKGIPKIKLIDRDCDDFNGWKNKYHTLVQNIRMISCDKKNVWAQQKKQWSTAAIGVDNDKHILFIHVQSHYTTHDIINILQSLPLSLTGLMYVEGGPPAQMYINTEKETHELHGSNKSYFSNHLKSQTFVPVPNVIGIVRK